MSSSPEVLLQPPTVSHNLVGQRLGRKGQETRERILRAALRLIAGPGDAPPTLTGVAREASVGLTTLYLYFPDLGELVLAALRRVMEDADAGFVAMLRVRWPDDRLAAACLDFLRAHLGFWQEHARILHLRNSFADAADRRFLQFRNEVSGPLLDLLVRQMDGEPGGTADPTSVDAHLATVLLISFERLATVLTNGNWRVTSRDFAPGEEAGYIDGLLRAEARLIALAIADQRAGTHTWARGTEV